MSDALRPAISYDGETVNTAMPLDFAQLLAESVEEYADGMRADNEERGALLTFADGLSLMVAEARGTDLIYGMEVLHD